jgi:hypothetical protein
MGLAGTVKADINPAILNKWLTLTVVIFRDLFIWASIKTFGVTFQGKVANSQIKSGQGQDSYLQFS